MADRTAVQAYILDCPPELARPVLDALVAHDLAGPHVRSGLTDTADRDDEETVVLGEQYLARAAFGTAEQLATRLLETAPDVAFLVWEDPGYEWLGSVVAHVPGLEPFRGSCDAEGHPVWTTREVLELLGPAKSLTADGERALGLDVFGHIEALFGRYRSGLVVVTAPAHPEPATISDGQGR